MWFRVHWKSIENANDIVNAPYNEGTVVKAKIISQNAWPKYQLHCDLDAEIGKNLSATEAGLLSEFEGNYTSRYQGRKLTWYHSLSSVTVSYGKMILVIPFVHFVTLKMFSREKLTLSDLNSQLKFPPDILQTILDDLVKYKLLSVTIVSNTKIYRLNINHNIQQTVSIHFHGSVILDKQTNRMIPVTLHQLIIQSGLLKISVLSYSQ